MIIEERYVLEYIKTLLNESKGKSLVINDKYHHNTNYDKAESIIKNGLLTINDLNNSGIMTFSKESLDVMSDISSHINGIDSVSLSVVGLTDLYANEAEYNPFSSSKVDIIVSDDIITNRSTEHYGNEFLSRGSIYPDKFKSLDIRLFKYINLLEKNSKQASIKELVSFYNCLKQIALAMKESNLDIPLREMSNDHNTTLDIDKLSKNESLLIKQL